MAKQEIKIATITVTVYKRRKHNLLPGWEYGTRIEAKSERGDSINPKEVSLTEGIAARIRKVI